MTPCAMLPPTLEMCDDALPEGAPTRGEGVIAHLGGAGGVLRFVTAIMADRFDLN